MSIKYGFLLFFVGCTITIIGLGIAFYLGSIKPIKKEEPNEVEISLQKLKER